MDEKKDLLIREICCKLQYGLMLQTSDENDVTNDCRLVEVFNDGGTCNISVFNGEKNCVSGLNGIKPYLRPMRTMTEEELKEYKVLSSKFGMTEFHKASAALDNWLDRKMFDHRGLIPKGLALEAKEGMYIKNEEDMTKKEILIRDLCGRLPYKPMVHIENSATGVSYDQELNPLHITMLTESDVVTIKPYLRHGFDTKEERQEYSKIDDVVEAMDYMLAKHIDCRDMVEHGSALEAPEGMYNN